MVSRRRFSLVLGAVALAPYSSFVQGQTKVWRVGFLSLDTSRSEAGQSALEQFPAALSKLGYGEGRNLAIEWRWADGRTGDLRELAAGLVRAGVDVIVARTNDPIRAAKDATPSIPIIMLNGNFPVETGLVESLVVVRLHADLDLVLHARDEVSGAGCGPLARGSRSLDGASERLAG